MCSHYELTKCCLATHAARCVDCEVIPVMIAIQHSYVYAAHDCMQCCLTAAWLLLLLFPAISVQSIDVHGEEGLICLISFVTAGSM